VGALAEKAKLLKTLRCLDKLKKLTVYSAVHEVLAIRKK